MIWHLKLQSPKVNSSIPGWGIPKGKNQVPISRFPMSFSQKLHLCQAMLNEAKYIQIAWCCTRQQPWFHGEAFLRFILPLLKWFNVKYICFHTITSCCKLMEGNYDHISRHYLFCLCLFCHGRAHWHDKHSHQLRGPMECWPVRKGTESPHPCETKKLCLTMQICVYIYICNLYI